MRRLRLSLKVKLAAGFGVVLALLALSTAIATRGMGNMGDITRNINERTAPAQAAASDVRFGMADLYGYQTAYVLADPTEQRKLFQESLGGLQDSIRRLRPLLRSAKQRSDYGRLQSALNEFLAVDRQTWAAVQAGDLKRAQRLTLYGEAKPYGEAIEAATALRASAARDQAANVTRSRDAQTDARNLTWLLALVSLLVGLAVAAAITRGISRTVAKILDRLAQLRDDCVADLQHGLSALAGGDLTVDVAPRTEPITNPGRDELGDVARAVNAIGASTAASVDRYNEARVALSGLIGEVAGSATTLSSASQQVATTSDEAGHAVSEIASGVGDVAVGAQRQVNTIDEARSLSREVERITAESAQDATGAAQAAEEARRLTSEGATAAEEATAAMSMVRDVSTQATAAIRALGDKSEQIGGIVAAITGIAEQTNLLALNAAIEAARAGEEGRGFAVVADEVRKLAEESQASAGSIATLVADMQTETRQAVAAVEDGARRTDDGVQTVARTRDAFGRIAGSIDDVSARAAQIAGAAEQIASAAEQLTQTMTTVASVAEQSSASVEEISASTQQTSASTQEIAASAHELARTAAELDALAGRFRIA